ncbi:dihydrofolate reductase [Coemansia sp. RSA 2702]|nr:dihydrofolate reductase [Coemansia sp. RSA 2702]
MSRKTLILIAAAAAKNNGIGVDNDLPWRLRKELAYFTRVTKTVRNASDEKLAGDIPIMNACILGRKSWECIPPKYRPLNNRYNIVISSNPCLLEGEDAPFTVVQPSVAAAIEHIDQLNHGNEVRIDRIFVVGGGAIYTHALHLEPHHIQVLLTRVQFEDAHKCDTFFPVVNTDEFPQQSHERLEEVVGFEVPRGVQTEAGIDYEFFLFEKQR